MSRISRRPRAGRRGERGAVALELALVLPLLVMLLMGTITGGMAYYQKISMADAVREGARYAATADTATPDWTGAVKRRVVAASAGELTEAQICVEAPTTTPGADCGSGPSSPPTVEAGSCVVRVVARKDSESGLDIGLKGWDITLVQDAYALYERTC